MNELFPSYEKQAVAFTTEEGGEKYEIVHHLDAYTDDQVFAYYEATDEDEALVSPSAVALWDELIKSAEGYDEDYAPEVLRAQVNERDKAFVIESVFLGGEVLERPLAVGKKLKLGAKAATSTLRFKAKANGQAFVTEHTLEVLGTDTLRLWRKLNKWQFPFQFGDVRVSSYQRGLCALYDALMPKTKGYGALGVPPHHKMKVVTAHVQSSYSLIEKK